MKYMAEIQYDKPCCDIVVIAKRVTKEKESDHLIPCDKGKLWLCNQTVKTTVKPRCD